MEEFSCQHIRLGVNGVFLDVYEDSLGKTAEWEELGAVNEFSVYGGIQPNRKSIFFVPEPRNGFHSLRFLETRQYYISFDSDQFLVESSPELTLTKIAAGVYGFKVVNYLGKSSLSVRLVGERDWYNLPFEIVPTKIDYEEDYVQLTEDIACKCASLLLDYASPTSLNFTPDDSVLRRSPLEQFIFIRQFCTGDNIQTIFSTIKNNPDTIFLQEEELVPFASAPVSSKFFSNPFGHSRNWLRLSSGKSYPELITSTRKYDSLDTVANRFIKFALETFISICENIIEYLAESESNKFLSYYQEAEQLRNELELCLDDSFFDDVQDLGQMPVNNQVLQKRWGYQQIYTAFNMLDLAVQLNWPGQDTVFSGQARNIALLYEYWLAFQLVDMLRSPEIGGVIRLSHEDERSMLRLSCENGLLISLQQGMESRVSLTFPHHRLNVDFYYNRSFGYKEFKATAYEGSYSRSFRPDYTLALYPDCMTESQAVAEGEVSFVHFDAKYRVEDLKSLFGDTVEKIDTENDEEIFQAEKSDSVLDTYKRGDLLKMHTYNDAIRKTIGSYVLYPGSSSGKSYHSYDELLPGVGAFAIRPGNVKDGLTDIGNFFREIISFKSRPSSRQYRREYFENMVLKSPSDVALNLHAGGNVFTNGNSCHAFNESVTYCMVGYMRNEYYRWLVNNDLVPVDENNVPVGNFNNPAKIYFFYHAIRKGHVHPLHKDLSKATVFSCKLQIDSSSDFHSIGWMADIVDSQLVSSSDLKAIFEREFPNMINPIKSPTADYYYLVSLTNIRIQPLPSTATPLHIGNSAISPHSPKLLRL